MKTENDRYLPCRRRFVPCGNPIRRPEGGIGKTLVKVVVHGNRAFAWCHYVKVMKR